jgi:hypothetical protein
VQGAILQLTGADLPELHLVYGLVPVGNLLHRRAVADPLGADRPRSARLEGAEAMRRLPETEQRSIVIAIVARETGVMAASALVIASFGSCARPGCSSGSPATKQRP